LATRHGLHVFFLSQELSLCSSCHLPGRVCCKARCFLLVYTGLAAYGWMGLPWGSGVTYTLHARFGVCHVQLGAVACTAKHCVAVAISAKYCWQLPCSHLTAVACSLFTLCSCCLARVSVTCVSAAALSAAAHTLFRAPIGCKATLILYCLLIMGSGESRVTYSRRHISECHAVLSAITSCVDCCSLLCCLYCCA
jgi:hypothetical protein